MSNCVVFDEAHQVRKLERDRSAGLEHDREAAREVIDIGHMGVDIVADDEIGSLSFSREPLGKCRAEELAHDRYAQCLRSGRRAGGRFDAETI